MKLVLSRSVSAKPLAYGLAHRMSAPLLLLIMA